MVDAIIRWVIRALLRLRYRIRIVGLEQLVPKDNRGIIFLPNHPALIDPVLMLLTLTARYRVGVLADRAQVDRPIIRALAKRAGVKANSDPAKDRDAKGQIEQRLLEMIAGLNQGNSFLLYPSGRTYRQKLEDVAGNSAVETILHSCPAVRVVLARTRGLWGSSFSRASGTAPNLGFALKRGLVGLLKSGILFAPRREVTIEFREPSNLPRGADRNAINRYLERFYNEDVRSNTYVPYSIWEAGGTRAVPEPGGASLGGNSRGIPAATQELVEAHLREVTGMRTIAPEMRLAHDLGLDSLARVELQTWIEGEFGFRQNDGDSLETVSDVLMAACGESVNGGASELKPIESRWFDVIENQRLEISQDETVTGAFLAAAKRNPSQIAIADQVSGAKSYRDLITAIMVMKREIERLDGQYIGVMLPASVAATVAYMATLFAGKTPVMINWTTGPRGVEHCLEHLGIRCVLSVRPLLKRLESEGFAKAASVLDRIVYLEDIARNIPLAAKLKAAFLARASWSSLRTTRCPEIVVVLFTSGSETLPKAVPLTNRNILTNLRDVLHEVSLYATDVMLGILPPFHSFGLTANLLLPLLTAMRVVFHPNPTEAAILAAVIEKYKATLLVGTPTFLAGIVNAARPEQLISLRIAVTGAESCPSHVYDSLAERCPHTTVIEGYGITECSPIVSANRPGREERATIGEPLPSVEIAIIDPETEQPVAKGERGMLLVTGPSVFGGYLRYEGDSPFVQYDHKSWYRTGDLVRLNDREKLVFCGRMKRFVKLGGEMISLPAIESALQEALSTSNESAPSLAVEAAPGEHAELVLFTTNELERELVNHHLRDAGLSPLHNIRQIRRLESIPLLGSGKTDYRALKALLAVTQPLTT